MALSPQVTLAMPAYSPNPAPAQPPQAGDGWPRQVADALAAINKRIGSHIRSQEYAPGKQRCEATCRDFQRWGRLYRGTIERRTPRMLANLNVPVTLVNAETIVAQIMGAVFIGDRYIEAIPGEGASVLGARTAEALIHAHLQRAGFKQKFRRFLAQWLVLRGTGIFKLSWTFDRRQVLRRVVDPMTGVPTIRPVMRTVADYANMEIVDLCSFIPSHLEAEDIDDLDWMIERHVVDRRWLKERESVLDESQIGRSGQFINLDQLEDNDFSNLPLVEPMQRTPRVTGAAGATAQETASQGKPSKIEVLERTGPPLWETWAPEFFDPATGAAMQHAIVAAWHLDPADDWVAKAKDWIFEIAGPGNKLIRTEVNRDPSNRVPYYKGELIPLSNEFYGLGVAEIVESQHLEANAKANMGLDERTRALNSMKGVDFTGLDLARVGREWQTCTQWRPDGVVWCKRDPRTVLFDLQPAHVQGIGDEAVAIVSSQAKEATGAVDSLRGITMPNVTATADQNASQGASTRMELYLGFVNDLLVERILPSYYGMISVYSTDESILVLLGEDGVHEPRVIEPENMVGEMFFRLAGSLKMKQDSIYRQQAVGFLQTVGGSPMLAPIVQQNPSIGVWLLREVAKAFGLRGAEKQIEDPIEQIANETTPDEENVVLMAGMDVKVKMTDNPVEHVPLHEQSLMQAMAYGASEQVIKAHERHIRTHVRLVEFIQMQQAAMPSEQGQVEDSSKPDRDVADTARANAQGGQKNPNANT